MKQVRKQVMQIFNAYKRYFKNFSQAAKFSWDVARGRAIKFAKVGTGEIREMVIETICKVKDGGLMLVLENGKFKQFYISNLVF